MALCLDRAIEAELRNIPGNNVSQLNFNIIFHLKIDEEIIILRNNLDMRGLRWKESSVGLRFFWYIYVFRM
jgi:hypothetical protein